MQKLSSNDDFMTSFFPPMYKAPPVYVASFLLNEQLRITATQLLPVRTAPPYVLVKYLLSGTLRSNKDDLIISCLPTV